MITIYRVQALDGRGPWRPGFSHTWVEDSHTPPLPPWFMEFGAAPLKNRKPWEAIGCGCRSLEQLGKWFLPVELHRLRVLGYHIVRMDVDRILAESENQVVFARVKPLALDVETVAMENA